MCDTGRPGDTLSLSLTHPDPDSETAMALFDPTIAAAAAAATAAPTIAAATSTGTRADAIAASQALTTPSPIVPPGMVRPYLAHQGAAHVAANGAIARHGCALLGDDMGMGKTQVLFGLIAER